MVEAVYWVALLIGVGALLLSIVVGDFLDFIDFDFGDGVSFTGVFFAALAGVGIGGLLGLAWFDHEGASAATALAGAGLLGFVGRVTFKALSNAEAEDAFKLADLIGHDGRCVVTIPTQSVGRVLVLYQGMSRTFSARGVAGGAFASGDPVRVVDVTGDVLVVERRKEMSGA